MRRAEEHQARMRAMAVTKLAGGYNPDCHHHFEEDEAQMRHLFILFGGRRRTIYRCVRCSGELTV